MYRKKYKTLAENFGKVSNNKYLVEEFSFNESLEEVDESLEDVNESLEEVDESLEKVDESLEEVDESLEKVDESLKEDDNLDEALNEGKVEMVPKVDDDRYADSTDMFW